MIMGTTHGAAPRRRRRETAIATAISTPAWRGGIAASVFAAPAFAALLGLGAAGMPVAAQAGPTDPPITYNAGMGTAEAPRPVAPRAGGVDAAGDGEAMMPAAGTSAGAPLVTATPTSIAPALAMPSGAPAPAHADASATPAGPATAAPAAETTPHHATNPAAPAHATAPAAAPKVAAPEFATNPAPAGSSPAPAHATAPVAPAPTHASAPAAVPEPVTAPAPLGTSPAPSQAAAPVAHAPAASKAMDAPAAAPAAAQTANTPAPAGPPARTEAGASPSQAAEAPAPAPLPPLAQALADLLAQPIAGGTRKEQEALVAWYGARQHAPVFVDKAGITTRGTAVLARLAAAAEDGLDPADYAVARPAGTDPAALARTELKIAQAALTYARHAQSGRFEPSRISALVTPVREIPDPAAILDTLAGAGDANAALAGFNPPHAGYKALKAQLAGGAAPTARPPVVAPIAAGPVLKPGGRDMRVPAMRVRFGVARSGPDETLYDPALVEAVKAFQDASGLEPDGVVGPATLAAVNRGTAAAAPSANRADIIANMERWRWLPRDLGDTHVMVNIPEFLVRIFKDGKPIHETRVVVGKPETPTPLLTRDMQYVVVNPAWNIPPSIARNEMMPLYRSDPSALARRGIQVVQNRGGGVSFRQAPGERNALGRIKFMFPNDHSVYLHDTPSRSLFGSARRAYSHGCVRVNEPLKFGEVIFNLGLPGDGWSQARIGKMFGASERYINLKQRFPVHIVYFTTFVDEAGRLVSREDIYGINARVKALLGLNEKQHLATR